MTVSLHEATQHLTNTQHTLDHLQTTIRPVGRPPTSRLDLAWHIAGATTYGPRSAALNGSSGTSDPTTSTETAALAGHTTDHRQQLHTAIVALDTAAQHVRHLIDSHIQAAEKHATQQHTPPVDGCELHARIGVWAERRQHRTRIDDRALWLCGACEGRIARTGHPPTKADLEQHHTTGKWPRPRGDMSAGHPT